MRVLGVDPGSRITGFALIECGSDRAPRCVASGSLFLHPYPKEQRLGQLLEQASQWQHFGPIDCMALERVFLNKNIQSAFTLSQARGVILGVAQAQGWVIREYAPRQVKLGVTGNGAATKQQVQKMVQSLLRLEEQPQVDCADAMAVALCALFQGPLPLLGQAGRGGRQSKSLRRRWTEHDLKTLRPGP